MRTVFSQNRKVIVVGIVAVVACGLLLANVVPASVSAPTGVLAREAAISPLAMMMQAPRDLPIQHYDAH